MRIGVLALQGDFALHARALEKCGVEAVDLVSRDIRVVVVEDHGTVLDRSTRSQKYRWTAVLSVSSG